MRPISPSGRHQQMQQRGTGTAEARWSLLYTISGWAALTTVILIVVAIVAHVVWTPPPWSPGAAGEWFARFEQSALLGLLGLDLSIVVGLVLGIPIFVALHVALSRINESAMALATTAALVGTILHLTSNTAFEMLALSQGYATATAESQRAALLAAGEAQLAAYYGTAFHVSYVLGYVAKLVIGVVMLKSRAFGKATAYVGILAGLVGLGNYMPGIGLFLSILSVLIIAVWNVLIARGLLKLGGAAQAEEAPPRTVPAAA